MPRPWEGSDRRQRLPDNWDELRVETLRRAGGRCQWIEDGRRCTAPATDVDHKRPGDDHSPRNLQALCGPHHQRKSSREGAIALARKRRQIHQKFRRTERHPGEVID